MAPHPDRLPDPLQFHAGYEELAELSDGRTIRIFALKAQHQGRLAQGYAALSPRSRYLRFMTAQRELSPKQLAYLAGADGQRHVALAAGVLEGGVCHEAAVARFVQVPGRPDTVEAAVTVVDAYQQKGLATLLLARLFEAMRERGYENVQAEMLSENRAVLGLIRKSGLPFVLSGHGSVTTARLALTGS